MEVHRAGEQVVVGTGARGRHSPRRAGAETGRQTAGGHRPSAPPLYRWVPAGAAAGERRAVASAPLGGVRGDPHGAGVRVRGAALVPDREGAGVQVPGQGWVR